MENSKVVLILIDGLRPDAVQQCSHPFLREFMEKQCTYSYNGLTIMPSLTLPCHMSLFHSVGADRHGIMDNTFVRPSHRIDGLFDVLHAHKKKNFFYRTWHELRDLCRPGALSRDIFINYYTYDNAADIELCQCACRDIAAEQPDFVFYYSGNSDEKGHKYGWMGQEYMDAVALASQNIERIYNALPEGYSMVITADHGGHARTHGTEMHEDMTIPIAFYGPQWEKGKALEQIRLLDIAPTIVDMLGCEAPSDWDGVSLLKK